MLLLVIAGLLGCEAAEPSLDAARQTPPSATEQPPPPASAEPVDGAVVLGRTGDFTVTLRDYEEALLRYALMSGSNEALPDEALKSPMFQRSTVLDLLDLQVVRLLAQEAGVSADAAEVERAKASHPVMARFSTMDPATRDRLLMAQGLDNDDLTTMASDKVLVGKLATAIVGNPADDVVFADWKRRADRVVIQFVTVPNLPEPGAVSAFVQRNPAAIESYFKANPKAFLLPHARRVHVFRPAPGAGDPASLMERAAAKLKEPGADAAAVATALGLELDGGLEGRWVVRRQMRAAFDLDVGGVSGVHNDRAGAFVVKLLEVADAKPRELDSGAKREVAIKLIRAEGPAPGPKKLATDIAAAWARGDEAALKQLLDSDRLSRKTSSSFELSTRPDAFVGGIGPSPDVMAVLRDLKEGAVHPEPILWRGNLHVVSMKKRGNATRETFDGKRETIRAAFMSYQLKHAVTDAIARYRETRSLHLDLKPLQAKYGVLKKPGK